MTQKGLFPAITSFVPRYAKLYMCIHRGSDTKGWWVGKQKPYGSKMKKFDVVGRSRGARNLPINIFIIQKLFTR